MIQHYGTLTSASVSTSLARSMYKREFTEYFSESQRLASSIPPSNLHRSDRSGREARLCSNTHYIHRIHSPAQARKIHDASTMA
jgi:hypothetical protein